MPQWRKLWTKTTESLDINDMPDDFHRLLWVMLPLITCREGRGLDNPAWIKAKAMPLRADITFADVARAMNWYAQHGMIARYEVGARQYFAICNWHKYQGETAREAVSDYPDPPDDYCETSSRTTHDLLTTSVCSDADADADAEEMHMQNNGADAPASVLSDILTRWSVLFPEKPQPTERNKALRSKAATRWKDAEFRERWEKALARASRSSFCRDGAWFTLNWFLANDENWRKAADGNYDTKRGAPPSAVAVALDPSEVMDPDAFFGSFGGAK